MANDKIIIYQLMPRWFTNMNSENTFNGTLEENGVGKLNHITPHVLRSIKGLGISHVWYTGVIEHATKSDYSSFGIKSSNDQVVKGNAGSPYAIRDYYDIDPDLAVDVPHRMQEFEMLVERTHEAGLKVVIDFVPNHVAREYHSDAKPSGVADLGEDDNTKRFFAPDNNFYYITGYDFVPPVPCDDGKPYTEHPAKATGNDCYRENPDINDWYETVKLNYGIDPGCNCCYFYPIPSTWQKMLHILMFWASKGVDAFRCDMAHMVPVEFWRWAIAQVKEKHPHIVFIAEIYDTGLYHDYIHRGGFDYLYDKVTLYDTLRAVVCGQAPASAITGCWQTIEGLQDHMLNFLENHDEQRIASPQFAGYAFRAIPALAVSAAMSRCPFMLYAGQELGEKAEGATGFSGDDGRTSIFDYISVDTVRRWFNHGRCNSTLLTTDEKALRKAYADILKICRTERAIAEGEFYDLMYVNMHSLNPAKQYAFLRHINKETILVVANFDDHDAVCNVNVPLHAFEHLGITAGEKKAVELISRQRSPMSLTHEKPLTISIQPFSAVFWKLK
ncbi:MAG: alpha-amylase [Muribaculaceae bacterium]|nr:alpha-amylase [Muribaculaceae bacterium]